MSSNFHAFMFPWFAFGHMTPFLHLANKLAEKGNKVTFLLPKKAQNQLQHLNLFPENFVFHPLTIPHVDGLPPGAETASDIPISLGKFLTQAMDLTRDQVESAVLAFKPDLIFFDFAYWVPKMAKAYKVKSVSFHVISASTIAYSLVPDAEFGTAPPGYPSSKVTIRAQDAYSLLFVPLDSYKRLYNRITSGFMDCDVISVRTCQEVEGIFCDYIELQWQTKVLLTGPMLPEQDKNTTPLEDRWETWLNRFEPSSVIYFALGSQINLEKDQFQELCLGMELTGLPFFVALNPPKGVSTIQEALPNGFEERVKERGVVCGEWVQQPLILAHPSVGCFVNHCGFGTMWESLVSDCQIVLVPFLSDQVLNTRLLTEELEVAVEVHRGETGWFSRDDLKGAIMSVMDKESEIGNRVRMNHVKWKEAMVNTGLLSGYVDKYVEALKDLVHVNTL